METPSPLDLINAYEEDKRSMVAQQITNIEEQLTAAAYEDAARLPEDVFGRYFIPLFAGDDPLPYKVSLKDWILIARTPFSSVNIMRGNTVLFSVPPVLDRETITPIVDRGHSVADLVKDAQLHMNLSPRAGELRLQAHLANLPVVGDIKGNMHKHLKTWNKIFEHYGRPPLTQDAKSGAAGAPTAPEEDDFDFEPL